MSIAGPCRNGKSYVLSEAFEQPEVFPLGHLFDPKTMGIWMWVVPQKIPVKRYTCLKGGDVFGNSGTPKRRLLKTIEILPKGNFSKTID